MSHHRIIIDKKYYFNMKRMHLQKKLINLYFLAYKKKNLLAFIMSLL
jgi:macrodomain Ter protein organizer (MatP/YcbG family)